ncbi:MAG: metallophosphoesterase [Deltaproteobacteria bacterium]|nr:metallophosphoesterase [Deltaproteobacteria bacterium]
MRLSVTALLMGALTLGCASHPPRCALPSPNATPTGEARQIPWHPGARIAVVGDQQTTSWLEFWRESNDQERERVVSHIATGAPALLVLLGDQVWNGSSASLWSDYDRLMAPVRRKSIPIVATPGNHDYWGGGQRNLQSMFDRFALMGGRTHGAFVFGPLGLVLVDSNRSEMGDQAWCEQQAWFDAELTALDASRQVRGVVVFLHHPPFTNSTVTGDEQDVQQALLCPFMSHTKTLAMVSGHVHAYERFTGHGKHFIVSGGGGGPRARLHRGEEQRRHPDLFYGDEYRPFNVVWMTPEADRLELSVMGLDKDDETFRQIDRLAAVYR